MAFDASLVDTSAPRTSSSSTVNKTSAVGAQPSAAEQSDRFLKLLVTQMQNQDPLNPMDNAQITTQMAQISTVSGIDDLKKAVVDMNSMMVQTQSVQAASLVGKNVLVAGKDLSLDAEGSAIAGFDLEGPADSVKINIKNASGKIIDTVDFGKSPGGRQTFGWTGEDPKLTGLTFEVMATSGGVQVAATPMVADTVAAVYTNGGQLNVETLKHGVVKFSDVKAVS